MQLAIGARAGSKALLQTGSAVIAFLCVAGPAAAQTAQPRSRAAKDAPWEISDNSFLVEEAFNQEPRIFQNIFEFMRQSGDWQLTFTQEWPAPGIRHQVSYTLSAAVVASKAAVGDVYLNYRFQAVEEGAGRPAFAPRVTFVVPSGNPSTGGGESGLQINLPLSKQRGDFYFHGNGGFTWLPRGKRADLLSPLLAASAIYRLRPMLNLMLESVLAFNADDTPRGTVERTRSFTVSPGVRGGWRVAKETQLILGAAIPVTRTAGQSSVGILGYFSYELPYRK